MAKIIDEPSLRNREAVFDDRFHAGELLVEKLRNVEGIKEAILLAIPAGGARATTDGRIWTDIPPLKTSGRRY
ncbi:MAG: hypothetical protein NTY03_10680 [Candidatus Bathyarchaeota archaeon]|nr:hypothetical protein [Candidatus Bathyarchaeota archaeon]